MPSDSSSTTRSAQPQTGKWPLIGLAVTLMFLLDFGSTAAEWRNSGFPWPLKLPFLWQFTGYLAFFGMLPVLLAFFERFPLQAGATARRAPLYLVFMVALALVQMLSMWLLRIAAYAVLDWGPYEFGQVRYVVPMEVMRAVPGYLGALGLYSLAHAVRARHERELEAAHLEAALTAARLTSLKNQLSPHFLFNALNAIRTAISEDTAAAGRMVGHLADFLRLALQHASAQEVPLSTELAFTDAFVAIMKARFEDRLEVTIDAPADLSRMLVPHLLLQPLVENAISHALDRPGEMARVDVSARRRGELLVLRVVDNGGGPSSTLGAGHGIGLSNTEARLKVLHGALARVIAGPGSSGGFEVVVELPAKESP